MTKHSTTKPPIELFGAIDENFYQLGLIDRDAGKLVHQSVRGMLKTPFAPLNKLIETVGVEIVKSTLLKNREQYPHLSAYAEGMQLAVEDVYYTMLVPELVSAMTKWAPGTVAAQFGCSSFFMKNSNKQMVHGRILDFPLQGTYDLNERAIIYQLDGMPKTLAYNSAGIPYPSITAMIDNGMTIALHQKFTNVFNKNGESIFEIVFDLIKNATDRKSAIEFLKSKKSITTWCLYMSFKNGDILAYDIMGEDYHYNEFELAENEIKYFCNHLENPQLKQRDFLPLGFDEYNLMRENTAHAKIKEFLKKDKWQDEQLLKMMATPKSTNNSIYQMDCITPSSILVTTLNPTSGETNYINGNAPKIFHNNITQIANVFQHPTIKDIADKKYKSNNQEYQKGLHALMEAQFGFDNKNPQIIYHQLQFAIDHLEHHPEQIVARFYFLIAQYIFETHTKVQFSLLEEFKSIETELTGYLQEQCWLFIFRLEYILKQTITIESDRFTYPKLKKILELELKVPRHVFHITNKLLIVPRIDILDVIYVYTF